MIVLTPYEYFLLRKSLNAYRDDERDGYNELSESFMLLEKKLFGVSSYENERGEDRAPGIVIGPERWDGDPDFFLEMSKDSETYRSIKRKKWDGDKLLII